MIFIINFFIAELSVPETQTHTTEVNDAIILEGACANETSLVILDILDVFAQKFEVVQISY